MESNAVTNIKVSVIITTYNHRRHIRKAIDSVLAQTYKNYELIVVDDGSTDDTRKLVEEYQDVIYKYQENKGLSAARNTGIDIAQGQALVFLDADDWLLDDCLTTQVNCLVTQPTVAFVSGGHMVFIEENEELWLIQKTIPSEHYMHFLMSNYIGMHAAVMYRNWAFNSIRFDTSLKVCEDYDMYLNLSRLYPVLHHQHLLAVYRIHDSNMSGNLSFMLENVLKVLQRQEKYLLNTQLRNSYQQGIRNWIEWYTGKIYDRMINNSGKPENADLQALEKFNPNLLVQYFHKHKERNPSVWKKGFSFVKSIIPFIGIVPSAEDLHATEYKISHEFLRLNRNLIKGSVLEVDGNENTYRYGGLKVKISSVISLKEICTDPFLNDKYDCILLIMKLHLSKNFHQIIEGLFHALKNDGNLLLTVKGISNISTKGDDESGSMLFTEASVKQLLNDKFGLQNTSISSHKTGKHQLIITARAVKSIL